MSRSSRGARVSSMILGMVLLVATATAVATTAQAETAVLPVTVTQTSSFANLVDGSTVSVHVDAQSPPNVTASSIFSVDARICVSTASINNTADFDPIPGGNCVGHPLSASSDALVQVATAPPNKVADLSFKVGVGTDTYDNNGTPVTITCGPAHPCKLVLELLVPEGFVFKSFPLGYSGGVTVPAAPTGVSATPGDGSATVSWTAPVFNGGAAITSYTATASPGGQTCPWSSGPLSCTVPGLTNGTPYTFTVFAHNSAGNGPASTASTPVTPVAGGSLFHPLAPVRVLDSRPGTGNAGGFTSPWGAGTKRDIAVGGVAGVPSNADAVVLNVTVTNTTGPSFLSIWPAGQSQPTVSSLNWAPGVTIPNAVTVKLGTTGKISMFNLAGNVDVIADVAGYYQSGSGDGFTSLAPTRILDSRPGTGNMGGFTTPWGTGVKRDIAVGGLAGVPSDADAVVLNVTVTGTAGSSFLSIWPAGQSQPTVSSLNWTPGVTIPNAVTVKLGTTGKISMFNLAGYVDVIADVAGYYKAGSGKAFHAINPGRVLDSRPGAGNTGGYTTPWGAGTRRDLIVGGLVGVPLSADAVVLNTTVTDTTGSSFLSIWPAGLTQPTVSSLNWTAGVTIPNAVTVKLGTAAKISVFNLAGNVDVITDVAGYFQ